MQELAAPLMLIFYLSQVVSSFPTEVQSIYRKYHLSCLGLIRTFLLRYKKLFDIFYPLDFPPIIFKCKSIYRKKKSK